MADNDEQAIKISSENAKRNKVGTVEICVSDGFPNINHNDFTKIICHPPYHANFSVSKMFIGKGFDRLKLNNQMYMVTKRKEWYKNKLIAVFGGVKIWEIDDYYVFLAIKESENYANAKPRKRKK